MTNDALKDTLRGYTPTQQGKVVAEKSDGGWFVIFPDGCVEFIKSRRAVVARAKKWFANNLPPQTIGFGSIEWRS